MAKEVSVTACTVVVNELTRTYQAIRINKLHWSFQISTLSRF